MALHADDVSQPVDVLGHACMYTSGGILRWYMCLGAMLLL